MRLQRCKVCMGGVGCRQTQDGGDVLSECVLRGSDGGRVKNNRQRVA